MVCVSGAQDVWLWQSIHIDLYREVSRRSHGPETSHKAVSIRCALPAVPEEQMPSVEGLRPGDLQTLWSLILHNACCETASSSFELPFFFLIYFYFKAVVCSLDQRKIFTIEPKHVSCISECMTAEHTILASSLSLLPWSHSSGFVGCKFWQVLLIFLSINSLLVLLIVYVT